MDKPDENTPDQVTGDNAKVPIVHLWVDEKVWGIRSMSVLAVYPPAKAMKFELSTLKNG